MTGKLSQHTLFLAALFGLLLLVTLQIASAAPGATGHGAVVEEVTEPDLQAITA